jgi:hypothetical protein
MPLSPSGRGENQDAARSRDTQTLLTKPESLFFRSFVLRKLSGLDA